MATPEQSWFTEMAGAIGEDLHAPDYDFREEGGRQTAEFPVSVVRYEEDTKVSEQPLRISFTETTGRITAEMPFLPGDRTELYASCPLTGDFAAAVRTSTQDMSPQDRAQYFRDIFGAANTDGFRVLEQRFFLGPFFRAELPRFLFRYGVDTHIVPGYDPLGHVSIVHPLKEGDEFRMQWEVRIGRLENEFRLIPTDSDLFPEDLRGPSANEDDRWGWMVHHAVTSAAERVVGLYPWVHDYCRWFYDKRRYDLALRLYLFGEPNALKGLLGDFDIESTPWYQGLFGDRPVNTLLADDGSFPIELVGEKPDSWLADCLSGGHTNLQHIQIVSPGPPDGNFLGSNQAYTAELPAAQWEANSEQWETGPARVNIVWTPGSRGLLCYLSMVTPDSEEGEGAVHYVLKNWNNFIQGWVAYKKQYNVDDLISQQDQSLGSGLWSHSPDLRRIANEGEAYLQAVPESVTFGIVINLTDPVVTNLAQKGLTRAEYFLAVIRKLHELQLHAQLYLAEFIT